MNVHTKKHHEDDCVCPDCKKTTFDQDFKEKVKEIVNEEYPDNEAEWLLSEPMLPSTVRSHKRFYDMGKEG